MWDCKYDFIWKQGPCRYNETKMRSYLSRVGPNPMTSVLIGKGKVMHRHTGKEHYVKWEERLE